MVTTDFGKDTVSGSSGDKDGDRDVVPKEEDEHNAAGFDVSEL
jgi:hypothetical protein